MVDNQAKKLAEIWTRLYWGLPLLIWTSGVLLVVLLALAYIAPNPTEFQKAIVRLLVAVTGAVVSTLLFGKIRLAGPFKGLRISATGPLAIFVLLQFVSDPFRLITPATQSGYDASAMRPRPCDEEQRLRSIHAETQSAVFFRNDSTHPIKVYWLDYEGKRQSYGTLEPHTETTQPTFLTNPWLVADDMDRCLAIYLPQAETPAVIIR